MNLLTSEALRRRLLIGPGPFSVGLRDCLTRKRSGSRMSGGSDNRLLISYKHRGRMTLRSLYIYKIYIVDMHAYIQKETESRCVTIQYNSINTIVSMQHNSRFDDAILSTVH